MKGGESCLDRGGESLPSAPGSTAPGTEIAAMERREARLRHHGGAPRQACRAASPAAQEASQASAFLGSPLPQGGAGLPAEARSAKAGWKTAYPAPPTIRAAQRWLTLLRHSGARAISAFTRVFDALWRANPESRDLSTARGSGFRVRR